MTPGYTYIPGAGGLLASVSRSVFGDGPAERTAGGAVLKKLREGALCEARRDSCLFSSLRRLPPARSVSPSFLRTADVTPPRV